MKENPAPKGDKDGWMGILAAEVEQSWGLAGHRWSNPAGQPGGRIYVLNLADLAESQNLAIPIPLLTSIIDSISYRFSYGPSSHSHWLHFKSDHHHFNMLSSVSQALQ